MHNRDIFVDFDGTICPNKNENTYPPPSLECLEVLRALKLAGNRIIIYSIRSNVAETNMVNGHNEMLEYLDKYKVPYDDIESRKPRFRMIIDDKGLGVPLSGGNVDWVKVKELLGYKKMFSENRP